MGCWLVGGMVWRGCWLVESFWPRVAAPGDQEGSPLRGEVRGGYVRGKGVLVV